VSEVHEVYEREMRDLPCFERRTTVVIELYRVRCPDCGIEAEKVEQVQAVRGDCGPGVRECGGAASGAAIRLGGEHGGRARPALSGTMGRRQAQAGAAVGPGQNPWSSRKQPKMRVPSNSWRAREVWNSEIPR
jgi:hypothetical protein